MNIRRPRPLRLSRTSHLAASVCLLVASLLLLSSPQTAVAQREHLTPAEIEQVRDNQELDRRIGVFVKAAERRLNIVTGQKPDISTKQARKQAEKDAELLGELPTGTRAQLLSDIAKILDEAIVNIDDAAIHAAKSALIPKSLRALADASARFLPQFTALRDTAQDTGEREHVELAIEHAQSIIEAAKKLPPETKKK